MSGQAADGPSEEELRAYLAQLREAPVTDLVAQAVAMLINAAQVKLGLGDGRLLIDLTSALVERGGERLDADFRNEVEGVLSQLRLAQVEAEKELDGVAAPTPGSQPPPAPEPPPEAPPAGDAGASRLWVPPSA